MAKVAQHTRALFSVIVGGTGIPIDQFAFQGVIDEDREFTRGGGDRLGFVEACGQTAIERAKRVDVRPRVIAAMRRIAAARLADGWVRELISRPPVILLRGASVSQDVKCWSVGQRLMSVPISETSLRAVSAAIPSICVRSTPPVS